MKNIIVITLSARSFSLALLDTNYVNILWKADAEQ